MRVADLLGRHASLPISHFGKPGAFLDPGTGGRELLLIGNEIPEGAREGDVLEVFVYLDSEDRPIATTRRARMEVGEVAFVTVTETTRFGAFVDWGPAKELLVPFAEQTAPIAAGERHPIGLYVDDTGRLAGTMRVSEMLDGRPDLEQDAWVEGEAWRKDERGLYAIVDKRFVGRVPADEPHGLVRGQAARFRVSNILPDGKIELSLRGHAHEELAGDAEKILAALRAPSPPRLSDRSSPEVIRDHLGLSKKAFKRAAGHLLRQGQLRTGPDGCFVLGRTREK